MNKKTLIITALVLVGAMISGYSIALAQVSNGSDDAVVSTTNDASNTGASVSNGSDDAVTVSANTSATSNVSVTNGSDDAVVGGNTSAATNNQASVTNGSDDSVVGGPVSNPTGNTGSVTNGSDDASSKDNSNNTNTNTNTSSSRRGSRSSGGAVVTPVVSNSCPLLSSYMRIGINNDKNEVTKLQSFLKNIEKMDVAVTGTFDIATEDAVKAFQKKYLDSVLGPWDSTRATGIVYITTLKKINEITCNLPLALSASELASIEAFKKAVANGEIDSSSTTDAVLALDTASTTGDIVVTSVDNTAAAGNISIFQKIWNFIKNLFR